MPESHSFEHLPLLLRYQGRARLHGGGATSPQTVANKNARQAHSDSLRAAGQLLTGNWQARKDQRQGQNLPVIPEGIPILLQVDPNIDLDVLRDNVLVQPELDNQYRRLRYCRVRTVAFF